MIGPAMAVAAIGEVRRDRSEQASAARFARAAALVADSIIFGVISFVVNNVFGVNTVTSGVISTAGGFSSVTFTTEAPWLIVSALGFAYFIVFEAMFGATPGKQVMRLKVVAVDGGPLTFRAVVIRNVLRIVDWLPALYLLGGFVVLYSRNSQRVGDLVAGTTVVYRHHANPGETRGSSPAARRILAGVLVIAVVFAFAFDYFARPWLVIEGMYNLRTEFPAGTTSYSLGSPQWGLGTVTFPVTTRGTTAAADCTGDIALDWEFLGWVGGGSSMECGV